MSQYTDGSRKTFTAGEALEAHRRVKITAATGAYGPTVSYADAADPSIGVTEEYTASGAPVTIHLANAAGTRKMVATAAAITANNPVYAAADGTVASTGTVVEGKAMETTGGSAGDILEVMPQPNSDISTAIAGTTNATFAVDTDAATPKIALSGQTAGTGDFTTTLKPEAALAANTYVIVPETADGDTLMALALAQTVTGAKTFTTANVTISGAIDLKFAGTTGQPEIVVPDNLADALSVKDDTGGADIFVITTTNSAETVAFNVPVRLKVVTTAVAAAGTDHTDGGQLARANIVHISSDGATKGVLMPTGVMGDWMFVINDSGTAAELYAAAGGTVNGLAANASVVVPASKGLWLQCTAADTWIAFDLPAKASAS